MNIRVEFITGVVICLLLTGYLTAAHAAAEQGGLDMSGSGGVEFSGRLERAADVPGESALPGRQPNGLVVGGDDDFLNADDIAVAAVTNFTRPPETVPADAEVALPRDLNAENNSQSGGNAESERAVEEPDIADPLEPVNRVFFTFNDKLYFWLLKPATNAYSFFVPEWGRLRVRNFFHNLKAPIRLVNALLQFKMHTFGAEFASFVLNSTVGIGGMFDIASRHPELKTKEEDLGQTLGSYGIGEGFYLVLPVLGPSSLRDTVGFLGDAYLDPLSYISPVRDAVAVRSFKQVNDTSFRIGDYEDIVEAALDPYISVRDGYKQHRRSRIRE